MQCTVCNYLKFSLVLEILKLKIFLFGYSFNSSGFFSSLQSFIFKITIFKNNLPRDNDISERGKIKMYVKMNYSKYLRKNNVLQLFDYVIYYPS